MYNPSLIYLCNDATPSHNRDAIAASTAEPPLINIPAPIWAHSCPFVDTAPLQTENMSSDQRKSRFDRDGKCNNWRSFLRTKVCKSSDTLVSKQIKKFIFLSYFTFVYIPKYEVPPVYSEFLFSVPVTSKTIIIVSITVRTTAMLTPSITALFLLSLHEKELFS